MSLPIRLFLILTGPAAWAGTDFVIQSHAQVNSKVIGAATATTCTLSASPNPVTIRAAISGKGDVISSGLAGAFYLILQSKQILNSAYVESTYYYAQEGNNSLTAVDQGVVWRPVFSSYVGGVNSSYYQYPYYVRLGRFNATVDGPGGPATCAVSVDTVCHYQPPHCNTELNGSQADGHCWYPMNNPPFCDWLNCSGEGCSNRGADDGCFPSNTNIRIADGQERLVSTIKPGDVVWNPLRKSLFKVKKITVGPETAALVDFSYQLDGKEVRVRVTAKHPIPTVDGLKIASALRDDEKVRGTDGKLHVITVHAAQVMPAQSNAVFNFELDTPSTAPEDHMIEANGIMTGDLYLQQHLGQTDKP